MRHLSVVEDLYRKNRVFCSSDYDWCVQYLTEHLPFEVRRFEPHERPLHGWAIPPKWDVEEAFIARDGEVLYDGTHHPLGVIALSAPFEGTVSCETLREHLYTVGPDYENPEALPFHFRQLYRPWDRDWGFCVPRSFYEGLEAGDYEVVIRTEETGGYLDVLEYTHEGALDETFVFVAHLDHPGMANDDLAGCAAGIELFDRLRGRDTKFSYRLVLLQEITASAYYLDAMSEHEEGVILGAFFLEMLGSDTQLALQHSVEEDTMVDWALEAALEQQGADYRTGPFRSVIGNDEIVWEAHDIPMPSLSRFPYPEYHTSDDNPGIIREKRLEEAVNVLERTVERLDGQRVVRKQFEGVPATSHPRYDLYVDTWGSSDETAQALRQVMDHLPIAPEYLPVRALKEQFEVSADPLLEYLRQWEEKNLIKLL
jgi:aminopeptidase-like protein